MSELWNWHKMCIRDRITARAEYFQKLTKNSLTQITLAPSLGFNSYPENMGTLENKGVELNFAFIPYQNTAKSAYWTISLQQYLFTCHRINT